MTDPTPDGAVAMWRAPKSGGGYMYFDYEPTHLSDVEPLIPAASMDALRGELEELQVRYSLITKCYDALIVEAKKELARAEAAETKLAELQRELADTESDMDTCADHNIGLQTKLAAVGALADKWDRLGDVHGVRQFTGNDHKLFANELRTLIAEAGTGEGG